MCWEIKVTIFTRKRERRGSENWRKVIGAYDGNYEPG